jgi:phage FluMu protein gp41
LPLGFHHPLGLVGTSEAESEVPTSAAAATQATAQRHCTIRGSVFLFLSPVTEGFFLLGKKTQTYGKIEGKHGKQIWKKLEKELNL